LPCVAHPLQAIISRRSATALKTTIPVWRAIWICLLFAGVCHISFALGPGPKITDFTHAAWDANEGAPSRILAIAQTTDGYLWIGSAQGLFRFDGLTFQRYQLQSDPPLPPEPVVSLLALPNGDLWIGFYSGEISLLHNGRAVNYGKRDGVPKDYINCLVQNQTGDLGQF
jgi:ligand-binding sensor domain-containing protein